MAHYNRILLAVDFFAETQRVVDKALELAQLNAAQLYLVHVQEPLGTFYAETLLVQMELEMRQAQGDRLSAMASKLGIPDDHSFLRLGRPAHEIHAVAREQAVDLIVLGGHGRSGWQLLLGSTANSVLHGAECDVLVVRIGPE